MKTQPTLLLVLHLLVTPFFSFGQQQKEWMHLHLDKDIYLPGETVWFKAYLYARQQPSLGTANLYVALYNEEGKLLDQKRYPVFDGTSTGDFLIPDSLASTLIQLKAFTKNMLLADSQHIYSRIVQVYQKSNAKQGIMAPAQPAIDLKIYPEGGTLINGVTNYIALKAMYEAEPASLANAAIVTGGGKLIDSVFFNSLGIGTLQFIPATGEKYWALWKDNQGIEHKTAFPAAIENGVALHTEISGNRIYYSIQKNSRLPQLDLLRLSILAGDELLYNESIEIKDQQKFVHSVITDSLPSGIFKLILSDHQSNIVQQKLIYIKNKVPAPAINILEKSSQPKGKNVVEILVQDTLLTNLSLSIADLGFYQDKPVTSISDELFLQNNSTSLYRSFGDEKGTNLVLLTQEPAETINRTLAKDGFLTFSLNFSDNNHALPEASLLSIIVKDKAYGKQFLNLSPKSQTSFLASDLVCYDSAKIYYQLAGRKELTEKLSVNVPAEIKHPARVKPVAPLSVFSPIRNSPGENSSISRYLNKHDKFNELLTMKEVVVKTRYVNPVTKRLLELDDKYATPMFRGLARGHQLNALDDPAAENSIDAFSYIIYRIPGLTSKGTFGARKIYGRSGPVILFINEVESPGDMLESVNAGQLAYIKYIPGIVIGSSFTSPDGALYLYTKKGNENITSPSMKTFYMKGYDLPNEFTHPDYSSKQNTLHPDYRSTLYWNPYIITDKKNNRIRIEYYNNDLAGKQLLTLQGFNAAGELVELYRQIE